MIRTKRETGERKTSGARISSLLEQRKRKVLVSFVVNLIRERDLNVIIAASVPDRLLFPPS